LRLYRLWATLSLLLLLITPCAIAKDRWTELNLGPFYVTTDTDPAKAREALTQLEQLRWVLGNILEAKDLPSLWPIRIMLTSKDGNPYPNPRFIRRGSQYLLVTSPRAAMPLGQVAGLLIDANTPRLPPEVESGLIQLLSTLEAHGSRVTWGGPPAHPDLAWARMQLFATKFQYSASFHIFVTALRGGSTLAAAERNAFGKSSSELESEAQANLAAGNWSPVPVSGRPLDPKRDFGEHMLAAVICDVYLGDWTLESKPTAAEAAYKAAIEAGGTAAPLGYEGLAEAAELRKEDAKVDWDNAVRAGSHSAPVYVAAGKGLPETEAVPLLKRAGQLNDRWAEPVYLQAQLAPAPAEKESLLKAAIKLDPRATAYWVELAQLQTVAGEGTAAQGSWLRAEDSAPSDAERERVHQLHIANEAQRLTAAEEAARRDRESVHIADAQAQNSELARIHAAEQKANQALEKEAGGDKPSGVVDWNSLAQEKKLAGTLTRVDCLKKGWRLSVKDKSGNVTQLFLSSETNASLSCGLQAHVVRVVLAYRSSIDDDIHTVGEINSLQIR